MYEETFLDEIAAVTAGDKWSKEVGVRYGAERIETTPGEGSGGISGAWKGNQLLAYFVVVRDILNWSVLVAHDLTVARHEMRIRSTDRPKGSPHAESQVALPFDINVRVEDGNVSIESELGRELAGLGATAVESARIVGVIEGIEQLLMSLAKSGVDLSQPEISLALTDCVERLKR